MWALKQYSPTNCLVRASLPSRFMLAIAPCPKVYICKSKPNPSCTCCSAQNRLSIPPTALCPLPPLPACLLPELILTESPCKSVLHPRLSPSLPPTLPLIDYLHQRLRFSHSYPTCSPFLTLPNFLYCNPSALLPPPVGLEQGTRKETVMSFPFPWSCRTPV
jgi:hypothetical protein